MAARSLRGRLRTLFPRADGRGADEPDEGNNGLAIALSFVVAVVLWFTFSMQETYTTTLVVPLDVAELPDDQALRQRPPQTARISVQGQGDALLSLTWSPPRVRLFADGPTVDVAASVAEAGLPSGVTVLGAQPRTIRLDLGERITRTLPIELSGRIRAAVPFDLLDPPLLVPDSVQVTGAESLLEGLQVWPTAPFEREDVREDVVVTIPLSDSLSGLVSLSQADVTIRASIGEFTTGEIVLPVEVENLPQEIADVRFEPSSVRASFRAPTGEAFSRVEEAGFRAVVDYADIARDTTSGVVSIGVRIPQGLEARDVRLDPGRVGYFLVRRQASGGPVVPSTSEE
ncbi:MAG: hypothetical protein AAFQ43_11555 [Bacteroidota bacterium]